MKCVQYEKIRGPETKSEKKGETFDIRGTSVVSMGTNVCSKQIPLDYSEWNGW